MLNVAAVVCSNRLGMLHIWAVCFKIGGRGVHGLGPLC